jgi:prepilin-type N-terminal cleavage/methylation domain-containing protein
MDLKKHKKTQKGFTIIELLITVVILGILVAIAAPSMYSILEGRKLKGAAENLFADLMFAKTESIKRNNEVILSFGGVSPAWCYGLKEDVSCDCATANDCSIDGIEKVVTSDQYGDTTLVADFPSSSPEETGFEPLRGFSESSSGSFSNGTATFTNNGREAEVVISTLGRVRVCSDTGFGGYEAC